jgi:hypothetical protein
MLGLLNNTLKKFIPKNHKIKNVQNISSPNSLNGSEIWTIKPCDKNRFPTAEMNYLRPTTGYTVLNHKRNEEILEELHVTPLED